jgi:hypothetical protein
MKKLPLLLLLLGVAKIGCTQNTNLDYKFAVKIYNLTTFQEETTTQRFSNSSPISYEFTNSNFQILKPTVAFQWKSSKNNFHEIELTTLQLGKTTSQVESINDTSGTREVTMGNDNVTTAISIRYEYIINFNKSKERKLLPSVGLGIAPYYYQNSYTPAVSTSLPTSKNSFGLKTFITPRLTYFLTSRLFIDANIPVCITDTGMEIDKNNDVTIPSEERTISTFNFEQFPKFFSGRIGIGIKL